MMDENEAVAAVIERVTGADTNCSERRKTCPPVGVCVTAVFLVYVSCVHWNSGLSSSLCHFFPSLSLSLSLSLFLSQSFMPAESSPPSLEC